MNKLPRKYWYSRHILTLIILCGGFLKTIAQNTFFIKIPTWGTYFPEVFEDEKGCIIAKYDFRITRISPDGRILWTTKDKNLVEGACVKDSQYYIFPALDSEMGGFRMEAIDYTGKTIWMEREEWTEKRIRTINDFIIDSARKQYIVAGDRGKVGDLKNIYYWIAGLDYRGKVIWEREWRDSGQSRYFTRILKNNKTGGYMLLTGDIKSQYRKELFNVDTFGILIGKSLFEPNPCSFNLDLSAYSFRDIIVFNDTMFLASVGARLPNDCTQKEGNYFYFYNSKCQLINRLRNDWAIDLIRPIRGNSLLIGGGNSIGKLNSKFEIEWTKKIFEEDEKALVWIQDISKSKDGGYIGIAGGYNIANEYFVYVFKTDSLGNINQKEEYTEKKQPVMLQPNPANNKVRIAIPYYHGNVWAEFYNLHGVFLFEKTKDEQDMYDISSLSPGMYIVKARIEETGETRMMRLIVQ